MTREGIRNAHDPNASHHALSRQCARHSWPKRAARIAAGERVLLAAGNLGELERYVDLCHEYEVPYRLGEIEEKRHQRAPRGGFHGRQRSRHRSVPRAFHRWRCFSRTPAWRSTEPGTCLKRCLQGAAARRRPKTASFFSDFSELKPGDYVVHVDHGIGQFEGLHQIENGGARGEFMRLRYADDARLYVPLERLDLVQSYRAVEGAKPVLDKLGGTTWTARKARVRKSVEDMADKLLKLYAERKAGQGLRLFAGRRLPARI